MRLKYITFIMILLYISGVTNCQTAEKNSSSNDSYILTPDPSPEPKINGAKVFGVRPGSPVIFTIPATGTRPMTFSAKNLPDGLALNRLTGRFSGSIEIPGTYNITLYAKNGSVS